MNRSDDDLIAAAMDGDRDAFATLYQRHHLGVYRFARAMTGSATAAEDVTQEVFLAFMQGLERYEYGRGSVSTYLYGIARNVSRQRLRRELRHVGQDNHGAAEVEDPGNDPAETAIRLESAARLRRHIGGLSSRYREVLILCDLQELSYEAAAKVLGTRVGTVRSRLHRARQMLTERLVASSIHYAAANRRLRCAI